MSKSNLSRKIIAVLIAVLVVFGWVVTITGIGPVESIKDRADFGLDIKGGVYVVMEANKEDIKNMDEEGLRKAMEETKTVIENRINANGLGEPTVTIEGKDRIRVEIPEVKDPEEAIELIGETAKLQFVLADGTVILEGQQVKDAAAGLDPNSTGYSVNLTFNAKGSEAFYEATKKAYGGEVTSTIPDVENTAIAIILDNDIISAPTVNEPINGGKCTITGNFTQDEANKLAAQINGGALPIGLTEITSSVQSASIGYNALEMSVYAGLIGLALILVLMIVAYAGLGLAADIALLLYVVLILNVLTLSGCVITLPGVAGIILSIGMAVDANVIIFSRIREELVSGKTVKLATQIGSKRAITTVMDSQITTLIAAVILYEIGTSSVKGFAYTFMIGIVFSLITAILITQLYVKLFAESEKFGTLKFFGMNKENKPLFSLKREFRYINKKKIFYCISAGIIIIGLICGIGRGLNYGIDFTGGTMIQMDMGKQVKISEVEKAIDEYNLDADIVYGGDDNQQIIIKTTKALTKSDRAEVIDSINEEFGTTDESIVAESFFGPSIGKELRNNAILAIVIAALCMMIYIRFRFKEWKFGGSALLGVIHDVLIVISFYAIFNVTVNNPFIAGVLTVVGYSINDTIVIFDRVRENLGHSSVKKLEGVIDKSINQTIGRSLMTSATTIIVMIPMVIMAGSSIREFVLPLMVGVLSGTYSSICVCSPLYYDMSKKSRGENYKKTMKALKQSSAEHIDDDLIDQSLLDSAEETLKEEDRKKHASIEGSKPKTGKERANRYVK